MVPHGRCDLSALIVGCNVLRHIKWSLSSQVCLAAFYTLPRLRNVPFFLKGFPRQGTHKRGNLLSVLYRSLDNLPGEWVGLWAVVGHSPKGEEKRRSMGKSLPHAPFSHRFKSLRCQLATFEKFLSEFCSPNKIVQTDLIIVSQGYHGLDTWNTFPTLVPAHGASFKPTQFRHGSH